MNFFDEGLSHEARNTTIKHSIDNIFKVTEKSEYSIESENEQHDKLKDDAASVNSKQDDEEIGISNKEEETNLKNIQPVSLNNTEVKNRCNGEGGGGTPNSIQNVEGIGCIQS